MNHVKFNKTIISPFSRLMLIETLIKIKSIWYLFRLKTFIIRPILSAVTFLIAACKWYHCNGTGNKEEKTKSYNQLYVFMQQKGSLKACNPVKNRSNQDCVKNYLYKFMFYEMSVSENSLSYLIFYYRKKPR